jgi:hypothetical protein
MGDTERASFGVDIAVNGLSDVAQGASALEGLQTAIEGDESALKGLQLALRRLKGDSAASAETIKGLKDRITATKASIGSSTAKFLQLGGTFKTAKKGAAESATGFKGLLDALKKGPGPLSQLVTRFGGLRSVVAGGAIALGLAAIAAAVVAVVAATGVALIALGKYALATADARRSEALRFEGLSKYRNFWAEMMGFQRKADTGNFLQKTVDELSARLPIAREAVTDLTTEFYRAGLRAGNLKDAVEAGGIALATQGQAGLAQFKAMAMGAALYGGSIKKVAGDIKARLGPVAEQMMLGLDVQTTKLKENFAALFRDVKIEPFLKAVKQVVDLFSQSTKSGRALKMLLETMFNPFIGAVSGNGLIVKRFFQGMILAGLDFINFLLDIRDAFRSVFGKDALNGINSVQLALDAGKATVAFWGGALLVAGLGVAILVAAFVEAGALFKQSFEALGEAAAWLMNINWAGIGSSIIDGIVKGITDKIDAVKAVIQKVTNAISGGFTMGLQIHSPSRVMRDKARFVGGGIAKGEEDSIPEVERAADKMTVAAMPDMKVPAVKSVGSGAGSDGKGGRPAPAQVSLTFGDINLNGTPADSDEAWAAKMRKALISQIQGVAIQLGVPQS